MSVGINEPEDATLRDLIRDRFSIFFDDSKQFLLQSRLHTRLIKRSLADFAASLRFLQFSPDRETEWDEQAPAPCNNER